MDFPIKKILYRPVVLVVVNVLAVVALVAMLGLGLMGNKAFLQRVFNGQPREGALELASPQVSNDSAFPNVGSVCLFDVACVEPVR